MTDRDKLNAYKWAENDCNFLELELQYRKIYAKGYLRGIQESGNIIPREMGKWIPQGDIDADGNRYYQCSCCGSGDAHAVNVSVPFCWKCGAIMRNEKSEQAV